MRFFRYSLAFTKGLITKEPYGLNFVTILAFFVSLEKLAVVEM